MKRRKYTVRFKMENGLGPKTNYSLREVAICLVETYSISNTELNRIVDLKIGTQLKVPGLVIKRVA